VIELACVNNQAVSFGGWERLGDGNGGKTNISKQTKFVKETFKIIWKKL
jgi:hypothetical protein